jgi:ATP-dependent DNA helicase PIF1
MNLLSTSALQYGFTKLSEEQKYAFAKFVQGNNVFITGPGGTGKTRLIQFIVEYMNSVGKSHQVCALTGCAATLLQCKAKTIHSWSGVRLAKGNPEDIIQRVTRNRCFTKLWRSVDVLIVDEVSMMSSKMFNLLDKIGRATRRVQSKPFGGIQLIFTGDFFQLPPISDQDDPSSGEFCFQHPNWATIFKPTNCIELKTFFRQTDPAYISILQEVRKGTISAANSELLETRLTRTVSRPADAEIVPTKLFPIRAKVDNINDSSYAKLQGEERLYHTNVITNAKIHIDSGSELSAEEIEHCAELTAEQITAEVDNIMNSLFAEKIVKLKIGALVMCTANIDVERGICNGSQGVVIGYAESNTCILPEEIVQKKVITGGAVYVPVVRFANGVTMRVAPHPRQSEEYPCIIVSQIPLCLAWALTIHKIQGATLDMAEMDIGRSIFAAGQSYVALSRVKTLDGLYLSEFNSTKIKANPLVIEFYSSFPQLREDEMRSEVEAIVSKPMQEIATKKQSKMPAFLNTSNTSSCLPDGVTFSSFEYTKSNDSTSKKDPTVKTIKLSRY